MLRSDRLRRAAQVKCPSKLRISPPVAERRSATNSSASRTFHILPGLIPTGPLRLSKVMPVKV
eukprot:7118351-Pyramimonas_sp.AAC.1